MAEPTALRLHDNQPFQDQLEHAVHASKAPTMAHLTGFQCAGPKCADTVLTSCCALLFVNFRCDLVSK
eukprot:scaffold64618_cov53-Attheya_sp.AAC.2